MRKVLLIAFNTLVRTGRDKKALLMMLLFPAILIGILGNALKGMLEEGRINPFEVVLVNADEPALPPLPPLAQSGAPGVPSEAGSTPAVHLGQMLRADVLGSDQIARLLTVTEMADPAAARRQVAEGRAAAAIIVPRSFSADVLSGRGASLELFTDPGRPTQAEIVTQIVGHFTEGVTTTMLAAQRGAPGQAQPSRETESGFWPEVVNLPSGVRPISAMQYYAAAMAIMFLMMTALGQARVMIQDRREGTLDRVLISPTAKGTLLAGQILGCMLLVYAQFLTLMLGTRFLFGVHWGAWIPALLLGAAFSLAASGVGMAVAGVLNNPQAADTAMGLLGNAFAALSGAMMPLYLFPQGLKLVAHGIPNYWALQGFLDLMAGSGLSHLWMPVAVLTAMGLAAGGLGTWRLAAR